MPASSHPRPERIEHWDQQATDHPAVRAEGGRTGTSVAKYSISATAIVDVEERHHRGRDEAAVPVEPPRLVQPSVECMHVDRGLVPIVLHEVSTLPARLGTMTPASTPFSSIQASPASRSTNSARTGPRDVRRTIDPEKVAQHLAEAAGHGDLVVQRFEEGEPSLADPDLVAFSTQ